MMNRLTASEAYSFALDLAPGSVSLALLEAMDVDELRMLAGLLAVALQAKFDVASIGEQAEMLAELERQRWAKPGGADPFREIEGW